MQVKCIKRGGNSWITPGKIYEAVEDSPGLWRLSENDDGGSCTYIKDLFEIVSADKAPSGTKLVCINSANGITKGRIYEKSNNAPTTGWVSIVSNDRGQADGYYASRFEVLDSSAPPVGAPLWVRAKQTEPGFLTKDKVYVVVGYNDSCYLVDCEGGSRCSLDKSRFEIVTEEEYQSTQGVTMNKNFDIDAFNKVLQASTNICAGGRADIAKAVAAGKGEKAQPALEAGQVWQAKGNCAVLVSQDGNGDMLLSCVRKGGFHILNQRGAGAAKFLEGWECIGNLYTLITSGTKFDTGTERFTV